MKQVLCTRVYLADEILSQARYNHGRDEELISRIASHLGSPIPTIEGTLADAPPAGFVLWSSHGSDLATGLNDIPHAQASALTPRLIDTDASASRIFEGLERLAIPAALDSRRSGVHGYRSVAARMGASVAPNVGSERYCLIIPGMTFGSIAELVAAYLAALSEDPSLGDRR